MKKVLIGAALLVMVLAGGAYYFYSNLDYFVKRQIETAGSAATGTAVSVDEVVIDLASGSASIHGLRVANPAGYSAASMLSFAELTLVLDMTRLTRDSITIMSVTAREPRVLYELQGNVSNLDMVGASLAARQPTPATAANTADSVNIHIARINIEEVGASLNSPDLAAPVEVRLGNIALRNLGGTPEQTAHQFMEPLIAQLSSYATRALLITRAGELRRDVLEQVGASLDATGENLIETGELLLDGLDNLLNNLSDEELLPQATPP